MWWHFSVTLLLGLPGREKARNEPQHLLEFSWSLFSGVLMGDAPGRAGSCTVAWLLWDRLGEKGTCQLGKQQVAAFLKEEHHYGATSSQLLLCALAGGLPERCLPGCVHVMAVGKRLASMGTGAACCQPCPDRGVRGDVTTL